MSGRDRSRRALALGACAAAWLAAPAASAYCRTTTCNPADPSQRCEIDAAGCVVSGRPLYWASRCVGIGVEASGSPDYGLDYAAIAELLDGATGAWTGADCGGAAPALELTLMGPVQCSESRYNSSAKNANILIFRNDGWPYRNSPDALGLSTVRFDQDTGEIWDVDIEINASDEPLSVGDPVTGADLASVLTHELGHFLGLAHTEIEGATMIADYSPGNAELRSLEPDDVDGVCAIYPPDRRVSSESCDARHGFSGECAAPLDEPAGPGPSGDGDGSGCGISAGAPRAGGGAAAIAFGLAAAFTALRRMPSSPAVRCVARFVLFLVLLALPWPGLGVAYTRVFAGAGNALLAGAGSGSSIALRFEPSRAGDLRSGMARSSWHVRFEAEQRATERTLAVPLDTRLVSYLPLCVFVSLGLAAELRGRRRLAIVMGGGLGVALLVGTVSSALPILTLFAGAGLLTSNRAAVLVIDLLHRALLSPGLVFAIPALIFWLLFSLTRESAPT